MLPSLRASSSKSRPEGAPASSVLHRDVNHPPPLVTHATGQHLHLSDGRSILDATCGAAVACLGHSNERVLAAMTEQMSKVSYVHSMLYATSPTEELAAELIAGTGGKMTHAFIVSSGSEAVEAALKLARQYHLEKAGPETTRDSFISRNSSYHGTTLGALAVSGHVARRAKFEPLLEGVRGGRVSPCYALRGQPASESDADYVARLAAELDAEFERIGPGRVIAFIAESVVGATLGCVPPVQGYFPAMAAVCRKHGALLICDEIMSGMGRCGTLHAWEQFGDDFVPDLQTIGKGLGGGYAAVAGVLVAPSVSSVLAKGSGQFAHGQTYQAHPLACTAALAVQREIRERGLVSNVKLMGDYLKSELTQKLAHHPNVADVRGWGLFVGIEFVEEKGDLGGRPFDPARNVAGRVHAAGLDKWGISLYPGQGTADGIRGDHILLAPAYIVTKEDIDEIVRLTVGTIEEVLEEVKKDVVDA